MARFGYISGGKTRDWGHSLIVLPIWKFVRYANVGMLFILLLCHQPNPFRSREWINDPRFERIKRCMWKENEKDEARWKKKNKKLEKRKKKGNKHDAGDREWAFSFPFEISTMFFFFQTESYEKSNSV